MTPFTIDFTEAYDSVTHNWYYQLWFNNMFAGKVKWCMYEEQYCLDECIDGIMLSSDKLLILSDKLKSLNSEALRRMNNEL